jgi:hypothetical protein
MSLTCQDFVVRASTSKTKRKKAACFSHREEDCRGFSAVLGWFAARHPSRAFSLWVERIFLRGRRAPTGVQQLPKERVPRFLGADVAERFERMRADVAVLVVERFDQRRQGGGRGGTEAREGQAGGEAHLRVRVG